MQVDDGNGHVVASNTTTLNVLPPPEIAVAYAGVQLTDGDITPITADGTSFGAPAAGVAVTRQWTITNTGPGSLDLSGGVTITGPNAADFSVTTPPAVSSLASGQSTTFRVRFAPLASGLRSATVVIHNNDVDESPFDFAVSGTGAAGLTPAEIDVTVDGASIPDGGIAPAGSGLLGWGNVPIGTAVTRTFSVNNSGTAALLLTGSPIVTITGPDAPYFTVTTMPGAQIKGVGTSVLAITFAPTAPGTRSATVTIANTDGNENPYDFTITGVSGPTVTASGTGGYRGENRNFTFSTSDTSTTAGFKYDIDWNNDGAFDQSLTVGGNSQVVTHQFFTSGVQNVRVTVTDLDDNSSGTTTLPVTTTDYALRPNAANPALTDLWWGGTNGFDTAFFFVGGGAGGIQILAQFENSAVVNKTTSVAGVTGKIMAAGYDSSDVLVAEFVVSQRVDLFGGNGDDVLIGGFQGDYLDGGAGNDVLLGGTQGIDGGDTLAGGTGRDVLWGHYGADMLLGGVDADLLVADAVNFGANLPSAVFAIQSEWLSARSYAQRVDNIRGLGAGPRNNANYFLQPGSTVLNDNAVDTLLGGTELDWVMLRLAQDLFSDEQPGEIKTGT